MVKLAMFISLPSAMDKWNSVVGGTSVRQADVSRETHFPRKFCPTGQDIQSTSRIICLGLGGKSVPQENVSEPNFILALHSYKYLTSPLTRN